MEIHKAGIQFIRSIYYVAIMLMLFSCESDPAPSQSASQVVKELKVPAFNRDSAYHYVKTQVDFGYRHMGSPGHEMCKTWITNTLQRFGLVVEEQTFTAKLYDGSSHPATNIIARSNPGSNNRIVLAAHWDTRQLAEKDTDPDRRDDPILGADDGGSGVAVLLELARVLHLNPIDLGIDFVFFDAEDAGASGGGRDETWCLGSQYWSKNLSNPKPRYGILLDMVGSKSASFPKEGFSLYYAPQLVENIWKLAQSMGYGHYFVNNQVNGLTDDHRFVNEIANLPMIDIINYAQNRFGAHHHTHNDDMDIIDKRTLGVVGQVVLAYLFRENAGMYQ